jgi:hypothetical protein
MSIVPPPVSFHALIAFTGSKDGARARFQQLIAQLVRLKYPVVRQVEPHPGDWGIDAFVGELNGKMVVWQSKFFIDGIAKDQEGQIREAFNSAVSKAKEHGYRLSGWVLCIPVHMDPEATKWWDGWKRRKSGETGAVIELWDHTELEALLLAPDAVHVRSAYFGARELESAELAVEPLPSGVTYDEMLFVKQLRAADIAELASAKRQFFNADLLRREVADKGVAEEVRELDNCLADAHARWETRFNEKCDENPGSDRLPSLYSSVMKALEDRHRERRGAHLPMSLVHRLGTMHHVVEGGDAGWVRRFREVASGHFRSTA